MSGSAGLEVMTLGIVLAKLARSVALLNFSGTGFLFPVGGLGGTFEDGRRSGPTGEKGLPHVTESRANNWRLLLSDGKARG